MIYFPLYQSGFFWGGLPDHDFVFRYWGALGNARNPNKQLGHDSQTFRGSLGSFHGNISNGGRQQLPGNTHLSRRRSCPVSSPLGVPVETFCWAEC